jgi:hypothetical protein
MPRARRWPRFLAWFCGVMLVVAVGGYLSRDFWFRTLRAYYLGRVQMAGEEYGELLPEVDEVEILALGGTVPEGTPDSFPGDLNTYCRTLNRHTIRGAEAQSLAGLWRSLTFRQVFSLCHDPYYGLRFRHRGELILETSICWKCSNVSLPVGFFPRTTYGFDAKAEFGQRLLSTLSDYAPHPPALGDKSD